MTAQTAERFINEHPRIDVSHLSLYFVSAELPVEPTPPENYGLSTDLWRGYVATWRLNFDGTLELLQFEFPDCGDEETVIKKLEPQTVGGNFALIFQPFFGGPRTKIPFVNGRVIEDSSKWEIDDQRMEAGVYKVVKNAGVIVYLLGEVPAFLPKSLLLDPSTDLTVLIDKELKCEIIKCDKERGTFIVKQVDVS